MLISMFQSSRCFQIPWSHCSVEELGREQNLKYGLLELTTARNFALKGSREI